MFLHNFKYRLLCRIRNRTNLFWLLIFPLVLATLYYFAFSNLLSGEAFAELPIAVVEDEALTNNLYLTEALHAVSSGDNQLFQVSYTSLEQAQKSLKDGSVIAYIVVKSEVELVVKQSGIKESIVQAFLNEVQQSTMGMDYILSEQPMAWEQGLIAKMQEKVSYIKEATQENAPDNTVIYFYSIFSMLCFYASFQGIEETRVTQANFSSQAARIGIAPTHKLKGFTAGICASMLFQCMVLLLLFFYMSVVLGISFGDNLGYIALTCVLGSFCGMFFGALLSSLLKTKPGTTETISSAVTMLLCFISGMMGSDIKYYIEQTMPFMRYINPVNLITDSLYSLYYFDTYQRFYLNNAILAFVSLFLCITTYLILRRQRYASI